MIMFMWQKTLTMLTALFNIVINKKLTNRLSPYFKVNYYDKLKNLFE